MSRLEADQWSLYWKKGAITTFQDAFHANYDGEVKNFWVQQFSEVRQRARIVDLACGNGALALLGSEYSRLHNKDFQIDAIDFADIQPPKDESHKVLLKAIRFHPGCRIEKSGLPQASYDLAVSQFGVEYGAPELTARELNRILKKSGARIVLLTHHVDSAIMQQARDAVKNIAICKTSNALSLVAELQQTLERVRCSGADPAADENCENLRSQLNATIDGLHAEAEKCEDPRHFEFFIRACMAPFGRTAMRTHTLEKRLAILDMAQEESDAFEARMEDLMSAAMDESGIQFLIDVLHTYGFALKRSEPFVFKNQKFAHALAMER